MSEGFLSPIELSGPYLEGVEFHINPDGPNGASLYGDVQLTVPDDLELHHENGAFVLRFRMRVMARLIEMADGTDAELMRAIVSMSGALSVADSIGMPQQEIFESLRVNGVSMFYAFARTQIELVTSQSAMGRFTIRPIDPSAYLRELG